MEASTGLALAAGSGTVHFMDLMMVVDAIVVDMINESLSYLYDFLPLRTHDMQSANSSSNMQGPNVDIPQMLPVRLTLLLRLTLCRSPKPSPRTLKTPAHHSENMSTSQTSSSLPLPFLLSVLPFAR